LGQCSQVPNNLGENAFDGFENIAALVVPGQSTRGQKFAWICNGLEGGLILFSIDIGSHFVSLASMVPHCTTFPEAGPDPSLHADKPRYIGIGGVVKGNWHTNLERHTQYFTHRDECLDAGRRPDIVPSLYNGFEVDESEGDAGDGDMSSEGGAGVMTDDEIDDAAHGGAKDQAAGAHCTKTANDFIFGTLHLIL
jgi:hypothetical protein